MRASIIEAIKKSRNSLQTMDLVSSSTFNERAQENCCQHEIDLTVQYNRTIHRRASVIVNVLTISKSYLSAGTAKFPVSKAKRDSLIFTTLTKE